MIDLPSHLEPDEQGRAAPSLMRSDANAAAFAPQQDDIFARIAGRYDRLCDVFSLFAHRLWKQRMARRIAGAGGSVVLDVASGTGDIPYRLLRRVGTSRRVVVSDICPEMLALARVKLGQAAESSRARLPSPLWGGPSEGAAFDRGGGGAARSAAEAFVEPPPPGSALAESALPTRGREGASGVTFALLDAHDLASIPAASVDVYSISFAIKICDRHRVVAEAFRVLKPGGLFLCLEAGHIPLRFVQAAYLAYMERAIPAIGWIATRDPSSYGYLLRGIRDFPNQSGFARELEDAGFGEVSFENMTFGIVALHRAVKPGAVHSPSSR